MPVEPFETPTSCNHDGVPYCDPHPECDLCGGSGTLPDHGECCCTCSVCRSEAILAMAMLHDDRGGASTTLHAEARNVLRSPLEQLDTVPRLVLAYDTVLSLYDEIVQTGGVDELCTFRERVQALRDATAEANTADDIHQRLTAVAGGEESLDDASARKRIAGLRFIIEQAEMEIAALTAHNPRLASPPKPMAVLTGLMVTQAGTWHSKAGVPDKIGTIKMVRQITGLSLREALNLVEGIPQSLGVPIDHPGVREMIAAGATFEEAPTLTPFFL